MCQLLQTTSAPIGRSVEELRRCGLELGFVGNNILFGSEMVGAVRGIDPTTGRYFDDTRRYVDALDLSPDVRPRSTRPTCGACTRGWTRTYAREGSSRTWAVGGVRGRTLALRPPVL